MASGGSSKQKSKSATTVWEPQQQHLKDIYGRAEGLYQQGPYEYGPGRVAGFDPASEESFRQAVQRGSALSGTASEQAQATMRGDYLSPESNPWLQRSSDVGARKLSRNYYTTIGALGSRLEAAGRTGSGAHAYGTQIAGENLTTGLGDFEARLYGGAYEGERGRQMQAMGLTPGINEAGWRDISALRSVGAQREEQAQRELDDLVQRFQFQQYGPAQKLEEFSTMIGAPIMTQKQKGSGKSMNFGVFSCWVAAEYFDWFTPAWFDTRRWIMERGPKSFRRFYVEHGPALAEAIRHDGALREAWRPHFERFREWGRVV
jgi:hypothetical protein